MYCGRGEPRRGEVSTARHGALTITPPFFPTERRYFLWALEKYRQGYAPTDFAHDIKPKKKVRGWGPRVQNGIRVRGRRRPGER